MAPLFDYLLAQVFFDERLLLDESLLNDRSPGGTLVDLLARETSLALLVGGIRSRNDFGVDRPGDGLSDDHSATDVAELVLLAHGGVAVGRALNEADEDTEQLHDVSLILADRDFLD